MLLAWTFVLVPLVLFLLAFVVELFMSFKRLSNNKPNGSYLNATWEVTHTFLVVSVALFVALFSANLTDLASASFLGFFVTAVFAGLRGAAYIYLFYVRSGAQRKVRNWVDWAFAFTHVGMVLGVLLLLLGLVPKLFQIDLQPDTSFVPWMWPGLILVLALCVPPIVSLYSTKNR
jgi:H+/Cl- antiporter ClcA